MSLRRFPLIAATLSLFLCSGLVHATDYTFEDRDDNDGSNVVIDDPTPDDGYCSIEEALSAVTWQEASEDCEAGSGVDKFFFEEGKTFVLDSELTAGGGFRQLDIDGDGNFDGRFLAPLAEEGEEPVADEDLPIVGNVLREADTGFDYNRDGDFTDTYLAILSESNTAPIYQIDYNEDGDMVDSFSGLFYERNHIDTGLPNDPGQQYGIDINHNGSRDDIFEVVEEFPARDITFNLTLSVLRDGPFDDDIKVNPIIQAASGQRLFDIQPGITVNLKGVTLQGNGVVVGDGGLIYNQGRLTVTEASILQSGSADNGGAIFMADDAATLTVDNASFLGNTASGNGGALAMVGTYTGIMSVARLYAAGNQAVQGGVIYLNGDTPILSAENSTFFGNTATAVDGGAALRLEALDRVALLTNLTIAGNDGGAGISFAASGAENNDVLANLVIVGNVGGSCVDDDAGGANKTLARIAYVVHDGSVGTSACQTADIEGRIDTGDAPGDTTPNLDNTGTMALLRGVRTLDGTEGPCPDVLGSADCTPLVRATTEDQEGWTGFLPTVTDPGVVPTLIDSGAPVEATSDGCAASDQRDFSRESDCDPGAMELRIAKGQIDEFSVVQGVSELLDVMENDLGDSSVDCSQPGVVNCMIIDIAPTKGVAQVEIGADNVPRIRYQAPVSVHGVDGLHYVVERAAIVGGRTFGDADIGAQTVLVVEPASGMKSDSIGAAGWLSLLVFGACGMLRRRKLVSVLLLLCSASAYSATITVTSTADTIAIDGECTLREAIRNATDDAQIPSPDCVSGNEGRDTIELPAGLFLINSPLDIPEDTLVTITGAGAHLGAPADPVGNATIIRGSGGHRLMLVRSSMKLEDLTLEDGAAPGSTGGAIFTGAGLEVVRTLFRNNSAANGGAIYLNYQSRVKRTVKITASQFSGNSATQNGGAVSMVGQNQDQTLLISGSSFLSNSAGGFGGAIKVNLDVGSAISIVNSTFDSNTAGLGGDGVDLGDAQGTAYVINSTFVDHSSGIDLRNGPVGGSLTVAMSNSIYFDTVSDASGACSTGAARFDDLNNVLFGTPRAASCDADGDNDAIDEQVSADILTVLGGAIVPAAGEGEDFVPAHYQINGPAPGNANAGWVVDVGKGEPNQLVTDFGSYSFCRTNDQRGQPRSAGGVCDLGATELQITTAIDDEGSNSGRRGQYVILDVLNNDVAGEDSYIIPYAIDLDYTGPGDISVETGGTAGIPTADGGRVRLVVRELEEKDDPEDEDVIVEDPQIPCGGSPGTRDQDERCVVRYEARTAPALDCDDLEDYTDTFQYSFVANDDPDFSAGTRTDALPATVTVTIVNVPPKADDVTIRADKGDVVVFPFAPTGAGGAPATLNLDEFELSQKPLNAQFEIEDGSRVFLDRGVVVDTVAGTVTYYPQNIASPFDDSFVLRYRDTCGGVGTTRFTVDLPNEDSSGDFVGGTTGAGYLFGLAGLLMLRRRRR